MYCQTFSQGAVIWYIATAVASKLSLDTQIYIYAFTVTAQCFEASSQNSVRRRGNAACTLDIAAACQMQVQEFGSQLQDCDATLLKEHKAYLQNLISVP